MVVMRSGGDALGLMTLNGVVRESDCICLCVSCKIERKKGGLGWIRSKKKKEKGRKLYGERERGGYDKGDYTPTYTQNIQVHISL